MRQVWEGIINEALGGPPFEPEWGHLPALIRSSVSTPMLLARFASLNRSKPYADQIKPFNFLLSATPH